MERVLSSQDTFNMRGRDLPELSNDSTSCVTFLRTIDQRHRVLSLESVLSSGLGMFLVGLDGD
jgi:hypothetical protein